ncbi:MAG TPA: methyltransferase domain-containing protein [Gammaproteobacteria bacterium]|nr:methyltransferase domain-containing protein [Gammaproteobacteria bacterium]
MTRTLRLLLALLVAGSFPGPSAVLAEPASAPGADPSLNAPYQDPEFERWVRTFERSGREVYDRREAIVRATGAEPGQAVADVGAGTGFFTLMFAEQVGPQGRVYAVDISRNFIRNIERRAAANGFENVEGVVNDQASVKLPPESVDVAFITNTYHHFEQPRAIMASLHRALRPGGTVVVIDYRKEGGSGWVRGHVRAGRSAVAEEIESMGFSLVEDSDLLERNYFLRFRKVDR